MHLNCIWSQSFPQLDVPMFITNHLLVQLNQDEACGHNFTHINDNFTLTTSLHPWPYKEWYQKTQNYRLSSIFETWKRHHNHVCLLNRLPEFLDFPHSPNSENLPLRDQIWFALTCSSPTETHSYMTSNSISNQVWRKTGLSKKYLSLLLGFTVIPAEQSAAAASCWAWLISPVFKTNGDIRFKSTLW